MLVYLDIKVSYAFLMKTSKMGKKGGLHIKAKWFLLKKKLVSSLTRTVEGLLGI